MSRLNIRNLWIQQTKTNDKNLIEPEEIKITDIQVELNEEENKMFEKFIEKTKENSTNIKEIWRSTEVELPQEWDMREEIPEEINEISEETSTIIEEMTWENMEEIRKSINTSGNSLIKETFERISREMTEETNDDDQMEMNDEENLSEELSELEDEPPRVSRKRRNEEELQETRKKKKLERKSELVEELIQELETPVFEEELIENEIEENMKQNDIRILVKMFHGIEKVNRKQIKKWFNYGKRFEQQVEETKNKSKKRITDQTARGRVYEEMRKQMVGNITKGAIRKRTQGCIKIYELFMEIGREKISRIKDCTVDKLVRLTKEEIKQIKNYFRKE